MPKRKKRTCPTDTRLLAYSNGLKRGKRIALGNVLDLYDELRAEYELNHCCDMWDFFEDVEDRLNSVISKTYKEV